MFLRRKEKASRGAGPQMILQTAKAKSRRKK